MPFITWCDQSWLANTIRDSNWMFAAIESVHLLGLALIGGTVLLVDLRLLGVLLPGQPVAALERDSRPWLVASLVVLIATGVLLFFSEPVKCYYSIPFRIKMSALVPAIVFTLTFRRRVTAVPADTHSRWRGRATALTSLLLWGIVAWGGRWIGFSN